VTDCEIIALANELGLHCDHDDDPENAAEETIYLWHDADEQPDGGILIAWRDGRAHIIDSRAGGSDAGDEYGAHGNCASLEVDIRNYAVHWNGRMKMKGPMPVKCAQQVKKKKRKRPPAVPTGIKGRRQRTSQRKEGAFKAIDPLGHFYYVEVFREVLPARKDGPLMLVTADGESVEWIAKGRYRLAQQRIELTSNDPAAP
jgi:hypothetical protein